MAFALNAETRQQLNAVPMNDSASRLTLATPAPQAPVATPTPAFKPAEKKLG